MVDTRPDCMRHSLDSRLTGDLHWKPSDTLRTVGGCTSGVEPYWKRARGGTGVCVRHLVLGSWTDRCCMQAHTVHGWASIRESSHRCQCMAMRASCSFHHRRRCDHRRPRSSLAGLVGGSDSAAEGDMLRDSVVRSERCNSECTDPHILAGAGYRPCPGRTLCAQPSIGLIM